MSNKISITLKIISVLCLSIIVSGCVTGPDGYLKRSANNKLFDSRGFKGGKRTPLYNKKYVAQAKRNVVSGQYDDDEYLFDPNSEEEDIALANREMYREMVREDHDPNRSRRSRWSLFSRPKKSDRYPVTNQASHMIMEQEDESKEHLKKELNEIRSMLKEARKDFASYKCPTPADLEGEYQPTRSKKQRAKQELEDSLVRDQDKDIVGTEIVDPVQSI